jgi:hypothetical protein
MKDGVDEGMNEGINGVCVVCVCVDKRARE